MSYDLSGLDVRQAVEQAQTQQPQHKAQVSLRTRKLFMVLQGAYGNLFSAKFSNGDLNDDGSDKGMRAALLVWDSALARHADDVVEAAAQRIQRDSPDFAPNLPQFERLCEALAPRQTWAQENRLPALPPPEVVVAQAVDFTREGDGKDWARSILVQAQAGQKKTPTVLRFAREALGVAA